MEKNLRIHELYRKNRVRSFLLLMALFLVSFFSVLEVKAQETYLFKYNGPWNTLTATPNTSGVSQLGLATDLRGNLTNSTVTETTNTPETRAAFFNRAGYFQVDFTAPAGQVSFLYNTTYSTSTVNTFRGNFIVEEATTPGGQYTAIGNGITSFNATSYGASNSANIIPSSTARSIRFRLVSLGGGLPFYLDQIAITQRQIAGDIEVFGGGNIQATGSTYNFPSQNLKTVSTPVQFTIYNLGLEETLTLPTTGAITLTNTTGNAFEITKYPTDLNLEPGETTTFEVVFKPSTSTGLKAGNIKISSNDADENPYTINLTGIAELLAPTISDFTPKQGGAGAVVTITGTNLINIAQVLFNGNEAAYTTVSDSEISAIVPAAATTGEITVSNVTGAGSATTTSDFTFIPAPVISGINPAAGPTGTWVTIEGTNLDNLLSVTIGGASAVVTNASSTQLTAQVPSAATIGAGQLVVTTEGGSAQTEFTVIRTNITSFTPSSGPVGTLVTVMGTNFPEFAGLLFTDNLGNYSYADDFTVNVERTQVSGYVPANAVTGKIAIDDENGVIMAVSTTDFTLTLPAPTITSLSSTSGVIGDYINVYGTNLTGIQSLTFNGILASEVAPSLSGEQLQVRVPAGAQTGTLTVTTSGGTATAYFTVISPSPSADIEVWQDVTVYRTGETYDFGSRNIATTNQVTFTIYNQGTAPLTISSYSLAGTNPDQFEITSEAASPIAAGGNATLVVSFNPTSDESAGRSATLTIANNDADELQYVIHLTGTAVSPITEIIKPDGFEGETVRIIGNDLADVNSVQFNGTQAVFTVVNENEITAIIPVGATTGPVTVSPVLGATATSPEVFVVYHQPTITSFSPEAGPVVTTRVTINGTNFSPSIGVAFPTANGGTILVPTEEITYISPTEIRVLVPEGAITGIITVVDPGGNFSTTEAFVVEEPLPVELLSFTGSRSAKGVQLNWQTASESNNDYFQVESATSLQEGAFKPVMKVPSKVHNSAEVTSYEALDTAPPAASTVYYRLKQVDLDGKFEYSKTIAVEQQSPYEATAPLKVYPNPFLGSDHLNVEVAATQAGNLTIVLYHVSGKKAFEKVVAVERGVSTVKLPLLEKLQAGLYILSTELNGQVNTMRVVKQ